MPKLISRLRRTLCRIATPGTTNRRRQRVGQLPATSTLESRVLLSGTAVLVEDLRAGGGIHNGTAASNPSAAINVSGTTWFTANDGVNGRELWKINSAGIAQMVEDSIPGSGIGPGERGSDPAGLTNVSGVLYFTADNGSSGRELWRINSSGVAEIVEDAVAGDGIRSVPISVYSSGSNNGGYGSSGYYLDQPGGSKPEGLSNINGTLYFTADDGLNGRELWRVNSGGIAEMVEDAVAGNGINPVPRTQYPTYPIGNVTLVPGDSNPSHLTTVGGTLYFTANDGTNGASLWRINSAGKAEPVDDGVPGNTDTNPSQLTNVGGTLYFTANDGTNGIELWRIDSSGSAVMVDDSIAGAGINPGIAGASPIYLLNVSGTLYFSASNPTVGQELWRVNSAGVAVVVEDGVAGGGIGPTSQSAAVNGLTNVNGTLYFRATDGTNGRELWRINSAGTAVMVEDSVAGGGIRPGAAESSPFYLQNVGGVLYFVADDGTNGAELWQVGAGGVATLVEDAVAGGGIRPGSTGASVSGMTNVNGTLFFSADDGTRGVELWRINSSGTAEVVEDSEVGGGIGALDTSARPRNLANSNGTLYFLADNGRDGDELWRVTPTGTAAQIEDSTAGGGINGRGVSSSPRLPLNVNGTLYFSASDERNGAELWRINSNGVAEMVENSIPGGGINPGAAASDVQYLTNVGGVLYFEAADGVNGRELWRINSAGIAELVEDSVSGGGIRPGSAGATVYSLTNVNGVLYFLANDGANGAELWRINSAGIAQLVEDSVPGGGIRPGVSGPFVRNMTSVGSTLYFTAMDGTNGTELWRINSQGFAEMVEDAIPGGGISPGIGESAPSQLTNVNGVLYFAASDGTSGTELWRINSQGIAVMVEDSIAGGGIGPGGSGANIGRLTTVNSTLYFQADDGVRGLELWRINSSGTAEIVEDAVAGGGISAGPGSSTPFALTNISGRLYFSADDGINGQELWRITNAGVAEMVEDSVPGNGLNAVLDVRYIDGVGDVSYPGGSFPSKMTNVNGTLYFVGFDGINGMEVWRVNSAGVAELIEDAVPGAGILPGVQSILPDALTEAGGTLYFTGTDVQNGSELWRINSSGVAELVEDIVVGGGIAPGTTNSAPTLLTNVNGTLYFTADDGSNGRELWKISPAVPPQGTAGDDIFRITYTTAGFQVVRSNVGAADVNFGTFPLNTLLSIPGLAGNDSVVITATSGSDTFQVTGTSVVVNGAGIALSSIENIQLAGGSGNDTYRFDTDIMTGLVALDESLGGVDTLDFSLTTTAAVNVDLSLPGIQVVNNRLSLQLNSGTAFEKVIGGAGNDVLKGNELHNALDGRGGSDTLTGGLGSDTYIFSPAAAAEADSIVEVAGQGTDTLNFAALTTPVTVSLGNAAAPQNVHANRTLLISSAVALENIIGGSAGDSLTGNALGNSFTGNSGNDTLTGSTGNDTYFFATAAVAEADSVIEVPGQGTDTLNFAAITTAVTMNLSSAAAPQAVHANRTLRISSGNAIENLIGGSGNDTLTGNSLANIINGGIGNDTYVFAAATSPEADVVIEQPNQGTDTLNVSAITTAVSINLGNGGVVQNVHLNRTLVISSSVAMENVIGGSGHDILTGNSLSNSLAGNGGNDTLTGGGGSDTLTGGLGGDTYIFSPAAAAEADSIVEAAGQGTDTLNFAALTTPVTVNLGNAAAPQNVHTNRTLLISSAVALENIIGGSAGDSLTGNALGNSFTGNSGNDTLTGSTGNDTYFFATAAVAEADSVIEVPGQGTDTLNFAAITTAVTMNLSSAAAPQAVHANRTLRISSGNAIENLIGGSGNDTLTGNSLANIINGGIGNDLILGQGGNDTISGNGGIDLLVGGRDQDQLFGNEAEDLLITGYTVFGDVEENLIFLMVLQIQWTSADPIATRINTLSPLLTAGTSVKNDGVADQVTSNTEAGLDWLFASAGDTINKDAADILTLL